MAISRVRYQKEIKTQKFVTFYNPKQKKTQGYLIPILNGTYNSNTLGIKVESSFVPNITKNMKFFNVESNQVYTPQGLIDCMVTSYWYYKD